jgi:hypothetical protein
MKLLILFAAILLTSFSPSKQPLIAVNVDWTDCPNAQGMMTFMGAGDANVYLENGPLQTIYLPQGSYCITFEVNAPTCTVSTTYSSGTVTHYDPMQCGETLLEEYVFADECQ